MAAHTRRAGLMRSLCSLRRRRADPIRQELAALEQGWQTLRREARRGGPHSFFRRTVAGAYEKLVGPAVSQLPRQAALALDESLVAWQDGVLPREQIIPMAQRQLAAWFDTVFLSNLEAAANCADRTVVKECSDWIGRFMLREGVPAQPLYWFRTPEIRARVETILRDRALPLLQEGIASYDLSGLDRGGCLQVLSAHFRQRQLRGLLDSLRPAMEERQARDREMVQSLLVTEELLRAYGEEALAVLEESVRREQRDIRENSLYV